MRKGASLSVLPIAILAIAILATFPGAADAARDQVARGWVLRVSPTWINSDLSDGIAVGTRGETVTGSDDLGISVAGEYRFSPRLGLEIGLLAASNGVGTRVRDGVVVASGTSSYGSFTVGPDIHLTPNHPTDVYLGPFLAYTGRTDVGYAYDEFAGVSIDSAFGWGAVLGVDLPVGERGWLLCASVRYIDSVLDGRDGNGDRFDLDFGSTAVGVGFGYRF